MNDDQARSQLSGPGAETVVIAPSLLGADAGALASAIAMLEGAPIDRLHVDVMDGSFVPNFAFGTDAVAAIKKCSSWPIEVHLMIDNPDRHLKRFKDAGAESIIVHQEACSQLHRTLDEIHKLGCSAGAAINPATPPDMLFEVLPDCDLALVMTIDPGFGGQQLIPQTLSKVTRLRREILAQQLKVELEVDGGVNVTTAKGCATAGADVLVAGTAVFSGTDYRLNCADLVKAAGSPLAAWQNLKKEER